MVYAENASRSAVNHALTRLGVEINSSCCRVIEGHIMDKPPTCNNYGIFLEKVEGGGQRKWTTRNRDSLIGQLQNRAGCYDLIAAQEQQQGWLYDYILYTCPDVVWYRPVLPWCQWITSHLPREAGRGESKYRFWDHAISMPREIAESVLSAPRRKYYACEAPFSPGTFVETWWSDFARDGEFKELEKSFILPVRLMREYKTKPLADCGANSRWPIVLPGVSHEDRQQTCLRMFENNPHNLPWDNTAADQQCSAPAASCSRRTTTTAPVEHYSDQIR